MKRRLADVDRAQLWALVGPALRESVEGALADIGMPAGAWYAIPGLRDFIAVVAVTRFAAQIEGEALSVQERFSVALELLGVDDDTDLNTSPADGLLRNLRRWRAAADKQVRAPSSAEL